MEKIHTKKELLEMLKDFQAVEILAREGYEQDVFTFKNFEITDTIEKIKVDEDKHIALLNHLIKILS
jgi:hypothetical protein